MSRDVQDEIFHVPQTQRYCQGDFWTWDPKITTPAGFHLLAAVYSSSIGWITGVGCHLFVLRSFNLSLWLCNSLLIKAVRDKIYQDRDSKGWSVSLSFFPVYWFYTFLFYTDMMSISLILLTYLLSLQHRHTWAALTGWLSILVRQTNVVWIAFLLFETILRFLKLELPPNATLWSEIQALIRKAWHRRTALLRFSWPHLLVLLSFVGFVVYNGGIVVGDKAAHQPALHGAQVPYLFLFLLLLFFPFMSPSQLMESLLPHVSNRTTLFSSILVCVALSLLLVYGRIAHPYLLADNRHVTFYLWRRVLSQDRVVFILLPLIWTAALVTIKTLNRAKGPLWTLAFILCSSASIVPSGLLELR